MKDAKFDEIWDKTIKPILDYKLSRDSQLYATDGTSNKSEARRDMESWYNSSRGRIKIEFMRQANKLIDRHKICACIYKSIAETKILKIKGGTLEKDMLVNAEVAFLASCVVLSSFMRDDAKGVNDTGFELFLDNRKMPCFPACKNSDSNDSYVVQTLKSLYHDQRYSSLSVLVLANVFAY
ncbi:MAG: hypothetical protein LBU89_10965 [Fibromonadaceae bacterium]|jgi:hypothetical protein|nr:hypothetical protein [Fibromonadaceae bacterium]